MAHVDLDGVKPRLHAKLGTLHKQRHHAIHIPGIHGTTKNVAAQQARRIQTTAGALQGKAHERTGDKGTTVGDLRCDLASGGGAVPYSFCNAMVAGGGVQQRLQRLGQVGTSVTALRSGSTSGRSQI